MNTKEQKKEIVKRTIRKSAKATGKVALNVVKVGTIAVVTGILTLKSRDLVTDVKNDGIMTKNIIKTGIEDFKELRMFEKEEKEHQ